MTSWVTAMFSSLMQLTGPASSLIANRYSCRTSVMVGGALMSLGLMASSLSNSIGVLMVTFGLVAGFGLGLIYTASIIIISYYFEARRTLVSGITFSASGLGIIVAPQISQALFDNFSWREALMALSAIAAQSCIFGALMFPIHEKKERFEEKESRCYHSNKSCGDCFRNFRTNNVKHTTSDCLVVKDEDVDDNDVNKLALITVNGSIINDDNDVEDPRSPMLSANNENIDDNDRNNAVLIDKHIQEDNSENISLPYRNIRNNVQHSIQSQNISQKSSCEAIFPSPPSDEIHCSNGTIERLKQTGKSVSNSSGHLEIGDPMTRKIREHIAKMDISSKICSRSFTELTSRSKDLRQSSLKPTGSISRLELSSYSRNDKSNSVDIETRTIPKNSNPFRKLIEVQCSNHEKSVFVVSRNPSLLSIVSSVRHLDVIIPCESLDHLRGTDSNARIDYEDKGNGMSLDPILLCEDQNQPLFKNGRFFLLCIGQFISNAGCGILNIHMPSYSKEKGLDSQELTNVISMYGWGILLGRCGVGALSNTTQGLDLLLYIALHIVGGVAICFMPLLATDYPSLLVMIFLIGGYSGSVYALITSLTISYVGISKLATAFGLEMVFAGLGYFVAPPFAGFLVDLTNSYDWDMYTGGAFFILSALVIIPIECLHQAMQKRHQELVAMVATERGEEEKDWTYRNQDSAFNAVDNDYS